MVTDNSLKSTFVLRDKITHIRGLYWSKHQGRSLARRKLVLECLLQKRRVARIRGRIAINIVSEC